jgi:hypothetical protein
MNLLKIGNTCKKSIRPNEIIYALRTGLKNYVKFFYIYCRTTSAFRISDKLQSAKYRYRLGTHLLNLSFIKVMRHQETALNKALNG